MRAAWIGWSLWLLCAPLAALAGGTWPRAPGTELRAVVWNVSREHFFEQREDFLAVLGAIDAELVVLDEMPEGRDAQEVIAILRALDQPGDRPWQAVYGSSGDNQRAVIAVRGQASPLASFRHLPYPPSYLGWAQRLPLPPGQRQRMQHNLAAGIGAGAAEVRIGERRLLVVGVDLQCCGDRDDAWEEKRRFVEVRAIRRLLEQAWDLRQPQAVIVAGDFNAVRGRRIVRAMQGSDARPARQLLVAPARHADGESTWTWDGRGTPFPSRPIDFLLHSRELEALQALVFDSETMSASQRHGLGLAAELMRGLSEHRPVVVDLRWR